MAEVAGDASQQVPLPRLLPTQRRRQGLRRPVGEVQVVSEQPLARTSTRQGPMRAAIVELRRAPVLSGLVELPTPV